MRLLILLSVVTLASQGEKAVRIYCDVFNYLA